MRPLLPFFVRLTLCLLSGIIAANEQLPWIALVCLLISVVNHRWLLYLAAFCTGYLLVVLAPEIPPDARKFIVRITEQRNAHYVRGEVQGFEIPGSWARHQQNVLLFSNDSLPAWGRLVCNGKISKKYSLASVQVDDFYLIDQDTAMSDQWRFYIRDRLLTRVDSRVRGISLAILTGDKSRLSSDTYDLFRKTGGAHILAVSGLHVGIIYGVIRMVLYLLGQRLWARILRNSATILMLWGYAMITGFSPSVNRATGFFTLYTLARKRSRSLVHFLSLLLFASLVWDPKIISSVSLQLSYLAVLGILLFQPLFELPGLKNPYRWIFQSVTLSISAQLLTLPLVAYYFGGISPAGIFTTVFLIPYAFCMIVLLLLLFASPTAWLQPLNSCLVWIDSITLHSLEGISRLPFSYIPWEVTNMLPYYVILFLGYAACKWPGKWSWLAVLGGWIFMLARH